MGNHNCCNSYIAGENFEMIGCVPVQEEDIKFNGEIENVEILEQFNFTYDNVVNYLSK
jgi:hypothetical protein